ncbi:hypothetical protein AWC11_24260 [Mycobacterium interjectum]|nr:hypothetical protein AWC11_24260 [Mycobacterium interjectum]
MDDQLPGRSATALASWPAAQPADLCPRPGGHRDRRFAGYETAATEVIPDAVTVMDPLRVVHWPGAKLNLIRQRIQAAWADAGTPATRSTRFGASPAPAYSCS